MTEQVEVDRMQIQNEIEIHPLQKAGIKIIEEEAGWIAALSLVPLPFADLAGITTIEIRTIWRLAELHNVEFNEDLIRNICLSLLAGLVGPWLGQGPLRSFFCAVPFVGWIGVSIAVPLATLSLHYGVTNYIREYLESGRSLINLGERFAEDIADITAEVRAAVGKRFEARLSQ